MYGGKDQQRTKKIKLVLHSDFTCPYCYLEFVRLTRAIDTLPPETRPILWHGPFQLDDSLPSGGVDKYEFLCKIIPPAVLDPMIDILCEQFRELDMEMSPRGKIGNSAPAHRLQIWADEHLEAEHANLLKDRLFRIHSCQGKSMSDKTAILDAAKQAGLTIDGNRLGGILADPKYEAKMKKMRKHSRKDLKITTVPCLMIIDANGKERILNKASGIETVDGFRKLLVKMI